MNGGFSPQLIWECTTLIMYSHYSVQNLNHKAFLYDCQQIDFGLWIAMLWYSMLWNIACGKSGETNEAVATGVDNRLRAISVVYDGMGP